MKKINSKWLCCFAKSNLFEVTAGNIVEEFQKANYQSNRK